MQHRHQELATTFGDQPAHVVHAARVRPHHLEPHGSGITAQEAVTFAKDRNLEREAVVDERSVLRDAFRRSMGEVTVATIRTGFEQLCLLKRPFLLSPLMLRPVADTLLGNDLRAVLALVDAPRFGAIARRVGA
jgi:hypothetical protein